MPSDLASGGNNRICISCFDAAIASTIIYIFLSKLYHATRKNAIPAMRISMRFNPTKVTNFVGLVFCTFVQRFRSSENTFFENFCRSRTQADNEMQILRMAGIPGVFALPAKCRFRPTIPVRAGPVAASAPRRSRQDRCGSFRCCCVPAHPQGGQCPCRPCKRSWQKGVGSYAGTPWSAPPPPLDTAA